MFLLRSESVLGEYEYVHQCVKLDQDIRFCLLEMSEVSRALCRTVRLHGNATYHLGSANRSTIYITICYNWVFFIFFILLFHNLACPYF